jgi:hypothetical protein
MDMVITFFIGLLIGHLMCYWILYVPSSKLHKKYQERLEERLRNRK